MINITCQDSLEYIKSLADYSVDLVFCDPPYGLGSEVIIRSDGKPDYKKASDFMSKWDMPTGDYWEQWFKEAFRVLKFGGHLLMFGLDRQLLIPKYYSVYAGFAEHQNFYWYFISSFPKSASLSKNIDKHAGVEVKGEISPNTRNSGMSPRNPQSILAKKYGGYRYSIAPLKQTSETIMVFKKPYLTGSCLHDVLAMEAGDDRITCGALDIEKNRVPLNGKLKVSGGYMGRQNAGGDTFNLKGTEVRGDNTTDRYPSQTFVSKEMAVLLDKQSGIKKSDSCNGVTLCKQGSTSTFGGNSNKRLRRSDVDGCSKILQKCTYEDGEHDLYMYQPKVSNGERNAGCEVLEAKRGGCMSANIIDTMRLGSASIAGERKEITPVKNHHPTLKPIALNHKILSLFKTPNPQTILLPFAGVYSEVIAAYQVGFDTIIGCELSEEYMTIGEARLVHYMTKLKDARLF